MGIMGFMAIAVSYTIRQALSLAIVVIVKSKQPENVTVHVIISCR